MRGEDEDDWVGTPPEGRHTRDRADPAFWTRQYRSYAIVMGILGVLVIIAVVIAALR
jgi:hypothetical protein